MTNKVRVLLTVTLAFIAVAVFPSNMAFKLNKTLLTNLVNNNINWVSLPYFNNYATVYDICTDINGFDCAAGSISQVKYFDTANNNYITYPCSKTPPSIIVGRAYAVFATGSPCIWKLVGSHDDSYDSINGISFYTNAVNNNINWISIPYHTQSANFNDLCTEINVDCGSVVTQIIRFDTTDNVYKSYSCGGKNPPIVNPGDGLGVFVNSIPAASCWHPSHY